MGSQYGSPDSIPSTTQRVKVYRLNDHSKWVDGGTGHISVDYLAGSKNMGLIVVDEEEGEAILVHRIIPEDIYRKQEETIISWKDIEYSTDLALSFQESTGCNYIWDRICGLQRTLLCTLANVTRKTINGSSELPPVELATLPLILKIVECGSGTADKQRVAELILHNEDFFWKLMEQFRICNGLENVDGLHLISKIVRGIILLNSAKIFEKIFEDEFIVDIMGCLELDPEVPKADHRNILKEHVVFKEAIPIEDHVVRSKMHQAYRVGYLRDIILPRALDEDTVENLNSIIHSNNAIVVSLLKDDSTFIKELLAKMKSPLTSVESRKALVRFLHEFCSSSKSLGLVEQHRLFRDLVCEGIFDIVADALHSEDNKIVLTGTDILLLFQGLDSNILRSYVARQDGVLFGLLVTNMLTDFGDEMFFPFVDLIRGLLEPPTPGSGQQREQIVDLFYEMHLGQLIVAITSSCQPNSHGKIDDKSASLDEESMGESGVKPEILLKICDLLCFCVLQYPNRTMCNFFLNDVIDKVLYLMRRRENYVVVAAIRFLKAVVSHKDEDLTNYFVKKNLLKPVIDVFVANGNRHNLLHSVVLELIEFIMKQENLKVLVRYLVDTFWDQLAKFETLPTIKALKLKYEQSPENTGKTSADSLLGQREQNDEPASGKEGGSDEGDSEDAPKMTKDLADKDNGLKCLPLKRRLISKIESDPKRMKLSPKGVFADKKIPTRTPDSTQSSIEQDDEENSPESSVAVDPTVTGEVG